MKLFNELWNDESGAVVSAELVLLGTLGVIGLGVGAAAVANSLEAELEEVALSIRSLDQSYHVKGFKGSGAWTAGSEYIQPPVEQSRAEIREFIERERADREAALEELDESDTSVRLLPGDEEVRWDGDKLRERRTVDEQRDEA